MKTNTVAHVDITPEARAAYRAMLKEALEQRQVTDQPHSVEALQIGSTQVIEFTVSPAARIYE